MNKMDIVVNVCNPSYRGCVIRRTTVQVLPWQKPLSPYLKITKAKRTGGIAQVVEPMGKALSSNSSTTKNPTNKKPKGWRYS
jgi:hypothetical protein